VGRFTPDYLAPWVPRLLSAGKVYLGFSGGLDSTVLLHALCRQIPAQKLTAVYIHHALQAEATAWQQGCERFCRNLGAGFLALPVSVSTDSGSLETAARDARYKAFAGLLKETDLLLLAHHRDDQIETVLYRLLRGSGPRGLAGMPGVRAMGSGTLLRPLLGIGRCSLEQYALEQHLTWVEDPSNLSLEHDRNFIRHRLVPLLQGRWPETDKRLLRSAALCREADALASDLAAEDIETLGEQRQRRGWSLPLSAMLALSGPRLANLLRFWILYRRIPVPGHGALASAMAELATARQDAVPLISWRGGELRRYGSRIYLSDNLPAIDPAQSGTVWRGDSELYLPGGSRLAAARAEQGGLLVPANGDLEIRFRSGGERCRPVGRSGSNSLKKLFQEYRLEPWLRDRMPLIYIDGMLAAVGDLFVCEGFQARQPRSGLRFLWYYPEAQGGGG